MLETGQHRVYVNPSLSTPELESMVERGLIRPMHSAEEVTRLLSSSSLTLALYDDDQLVGVLRAISDFVSVCYIADLLVAVSRDARQAYGILSSELHELLDKDIEVVVAASLRQSIRASQPGFVHSVQRRRQSPMVAFRHE